MPEPAPFLEVETLRGEQQVILRLDGELDLSSASIFTAAVDRIGGEDRSVVIDLADLRFLDSTGLGAIVHARRTLESRLIDVAVLNPNERARFVFELTGLSDLIATPG